MDPALLTTEAFWSDRKPHAAGTVPDLPELEGHVLFETSGSSGKPKWVALSKDALLVSAAAVNRHLRVNGTSRWGLALPLNHVGGFGVGARAWQAGCELRPLGGKWNPEEFRRQIEEQAVTHTSLVPTQVHDLVKTRRHSPNMLEAVVVGGGHLDIATGQAARDLGWPVLASYGMTECASQIATQSLDLLDKPYHPSPISLLPIWKAETDDEGILSVSGDALFSGYLSEGCFHARTGPVHVTTDRAVVADGFITPMGRADLLVKILGELVDPEAVERELAAISDGAMPAGSFAIVAVPDERAGNVLVPLFETREAADLATGFLTLYNRSCPGYRRLAAAVVAGPFPRSGLGKPLRRELTKPWPWPGIADGSR